MSQAWDRLRGRLETKGPLGRRVDATLWDDVEATLVELDTMRLEADRNAAALFTSSAVLLGAMRRADRAEALAATAQWYVEACLAIREAPYPSEDFKEAVGHASACYRALVEAFA